MKREEFPKIKIPKIKLTAKKNMLIYVKKKPMKSAIIPKTNDIIPKGLPILFIHSFLYCINFYYISLFLKNQ